MESLIPKRMFRAHDADGNRGNLFVLAHRHGPDGKLLFRPDSEDIKPREAYLSTLDFWEESELAGSLERYNEIPVDEGTEKIGVTQVSMSSAPSMKPARG